jgi:hypothetical protein
MATDMQTAEVVLSTVALLIGTAHWKLNYYQWLEKVGGDDNDYWQDKWREWDALATAFNKFDAHTLAQIVS